MRRKKALATVVTAAILIPEIAHPGKENPHTHPEAYETTSLKIMENSPFMVSGEITMQEIENLTSMPYYNMVSDINLEK